MREDDYPRRSPPPQSVHDAFARFGVDLNDTESVREFAADIYWLRENRKREQTRRNDTWKTILASIASAVVGALGVLITSFLSK